MFNFCISTSVTISIHLIHLGKATFHDFSRLFTIFENFWQPRLLQLFTPFHDFRGYLTHQAAAIFPDFSRLFTIFKDFWRTRQLPFFTTFHAFLRFLRTFDARGWCFRKNNYINAHLAFSLSIFVIASQEPSKYNWKILKKYKYKFPNFQDFQIRSGFKCYVIPHETRNYQICCKWHKLACYYNKSWPKINWIENAAMICHSRFFLLISNFLCSVKINISILIWRFRVQFLY